MQFNKPSKHKYLDLIDILFSDVLLLLFSRNIFILILLVFILFNKEKLLSFSLNIISLRLLAMDKIFIYILFVKMAGSDKIS
jgi:hypothetical protein